ncbi:MAG: pilus assembly protein, partial [Proteobacteria bacterium]|nr:pilus assembly protein [Pseudomonadota bacterium]
MFNRLKKLSAAFRSSLMRRRLPPVMTRLARDERGVIIVMFAFLLPIMIGFIGLGVEVAYWFQDRRDLQAAADAGAIAGAYEIAEGRVSTADTVAQREAEANGWSSSEGAITVNNEQINSTDPSSGNFDDDDNAIEVILTRTLNPLFIGYFMDTLTLTAGTFDVDTTNNYAVTVAGNWSNTTTITVTANDGRGGQETTHFEAIVGINQAPTADSTLANQQLEAGGPPYQFELTEIFSDPNGDALVFSATSSDAGVA